jgi:hypothetical protein
MRINGNTEITFNETWLFIQFKVYDMNFETMKMIVSDLLNSNKVDSIPFDTTELKESDMYFTKNQNSDRVKGCVLLQIEINKNQYLSLKNKYL